MKDSLVINMPYIGSVLSVNNCWIRGKGGVRTNALKPEVKLWMLDLQDQAEKYKDQLTAPVSIRASASFKDSRHPDMDNLFKTICDGLKKGLNIDDKYFEISVGEVRIDPSLSPQIVLELWDPTFMEV